MKLLLYAGASLGLILTIVPSVLVLTETIGWQTHADLMTVGMILWFVTTPWQKKAESPTP
jgi:hypothetical protein